MSVIQLSAGSDNVKERQLLVAVSAAGSGQVTVSLIIPTLNEAVARLISGPVRYLRSRHSARQRAVG
jgi:hypothetical protein